MIIEYLNYLDISDDIPEELLESIIQKAKTLDIDKLVKSYKHNIKVSKTILKDHGISISYIESQGKKAAALVKKQYKNKVPAEKAAKHIVATIGKETLQTALRGKARVIVDTETSSHVGMQVLKSIGLLIAVYFVSVFLAIFLGIGGAVLGLSVSQIVAVAAIVLAPLVEEFGKKIAIQGNYQWMYTGIFAGVEGIQYVSMMLLAGGSLTAALIVRATAVGMHFSTTAIQTHYMKQAIELNDESKEMTGYWIAVGVHSTWNFVAIIFQLDFARFIGL